MVTLNLRQQTILIKILVLILTLSAFIAIRFSFIGLSGQGGVRGMIMAALIGLSVLPVILTNMARFRLSRATCKFLLPFVPLTFIYVIWIVMAGDKTNAIGNVIKLVLLAFWTLSVIRVGNSGFFLALIQWLILTTLVGGIVAWLSMGMPKSLVALFSAKNMLPYVGILGCFFFLLPAKKTGRTFYMLTRLGCWIGIFLAIAIAVLASARVAVLSIIFGTIFYLVWPLMTRRFLRYNGILILMFINIAVLTAFMATMNNLPYMPLINKVSIDVSGRTIKSGRELIWPALLVAIKDKPILGWGPDVKPGKFFAEESKGLGADLSAHNLYLQVAFETGLLGLFALLFMLYRIWKMFYPGRYDPKVRLGATFFMVMLFQQTFSVSLTQQNMSLAILMWTIVGFTLASIHRMNTLGPKPLINR
jgi:O-antigen ligase